MELRVLKYFLAVAQESNMSRAAERMHTTQPNISRQIQDLEAELGKRLFVRDTRKIRLTEEGMLLRKRALEMMELLEKTQAELAGFDDMSGGEIRLGAAETHSMRLVARAMQELRRDCPKLRYSLFSGNCYDVCERLDKGLLDFGIVVEPVDVLKYGHIRLPRCDRWGVLMREDSPLAALSRIRPQDLRGQDVMCSRQMMEGNGLSVWFGQEFEKMNLLVSFNLVTTPAMFVEEGLAYALTFEKLSATGAERRLCFRPLEPPVETGLYLIWQKAQLFSRPARRFLEKLQEIFRQGFGEGG